MIIAQRGRPLTPKRTEYGKRIRKDYEGGGELRRKGQISKGTSLEMMEYAIQSRLY